jgi:hypothetical protein
VREELHLIANGAVRQVGELTVAFVGTAQAVGPSMDRVGAPTHSRAFNYSGAFS